MRAISLVATIVYGLVTCILTVLPGAFAPGWLSWIAEWWGVVTASYLFLTALPVAWILLFRPNTKESWEWPLESADTASSYALVGVILIAVPIINYLIPGDMIYWQSKIWIMSAFASGGDLMIAIIENQCQKNAPDAHHHAGAAGGHPPGGGAGHP
jgi:hypothetical protein